MCTLFRGVISTLLSAVAYATDVDYRSLADWQKEVLDKASFELKLLPPQTFFPADSAPTDLAKDGFLVFVCSAKENLGKRLLWIRTEVKFSNGYTRTFDSVAFHILTGSALAIEKLDFPVAGNLKVKSARIISAAIK